MADRSISFKPPMIRALLDGRKTQTRRILKPQPTLVQYPHASPVISDGRVIFRDCWQNREDVRLPYAPGDRLWCKEAWRLKRHLDDNKGSDFWPSCPGGMPAVFHDADRDNCDQHGRYRHARFMPRWASRLTLLVTDVRVQRLQEISEADAFCEGVGQRLDATCRDDFAALWDSLHGPDAWAKNPWVVALTFETHRCNIDQMGQANA